MNIKTKIAGTILGFTAIFIGLYVWPDICVPSKNPIPWPLNIIGWGFFYLLFSAAASVAFSYLIHGAINVFKWPRKIKGALEERKKNREKYPSYYTNRKKERVNEIRTGVLTIIIVVGALAAVGGACWLVGYIVRIFVC